MTGKSQSITGTQQATQTADVNGASSTWMPVVSRQLDAIRRLPKGWDSHGGEAPEGPAIDAAERLLRRLCERIGSLTSPHVHPTRSGGVQFEWESAGRYVEIEIGAGGGRFYFQDEAAGIERSGEVNSTGEIDELTNYLKDSHLVQ